MFIHPRLQMMEFEREEAASTLSGCAEQDDSPSQQCIDARHEGPERANRDSPLDMRIDEPVRHAALHVPF
jgi:hypothetical protein